MTRPLILILVSLDDLIERERVDSMACRRRAIIADVALVAIGARAHPCDVVVVNEQFEFALAFSRGDVQRQHARIFTMHGGESGEIRGHGVYGDDRRVGIDAQKFLGPCPVIGADVDEGHGFARVEKAQQENKVFLPAWARERLLNEFIIDLITASSRAQKLAQNICPHKNRVCVVFDASENPID